MYTEPKLEFVAVNICSACLDGAGGECHTPGCLFWMRDAPTYPVRDVTVPPNRTLTQFTAKARV